MLTRGTAWKEAASVFVLSRFIILLITYISISILPLSRQTSAHICALDINSCILSWFHWDAIAYVNIAHHGYSLMRDTVFFPLWPLLIHMLGVLFGASFTAYYIAGLLLSNICFYLALVVFYCLLSKDFEPTVAKNALFYLAFYPYALFFFAGYAEALFILLCLAVFFFLRRGASIDWWLAGLCGFLAALTRATGIMLVIPFLAVYIQRFWLRGRGEPDQSNWRQKVNAFLPIALIPAGIVVYMLYLGYAKGNPFAFSTEEASTWQRHLSLPWHGMISAFQALTTPSSLQVLNFLDITFTLVPLIILVLGWRLVPLHYSLFALAMALFSLSYPFIPVEPLSAAPRYMMVIFPIVVILALWGKRPRFDRVIMGCSLPLFAVNVVLFISHYWVA